MKKSILNLGKALNKAEQKEIKGGSFFHKKAYDGTYCKYSCSGSTASLDSGLDQICYLDLPYHIFNHYTCGGIGNPRDGVKA